MSEGSTEQIEMMAGLDLGDKYSYLYVLEADASGLVTFSRRFKRSIAVDAKGIPLGAVSAPANRHDSPLLVPTLKAASEVLGALPEGASVHLETAATTRA
jgi:hypothetical protein